RAWSSDEEMRPGGNEKRKCIERRRRMHSAVASIQQELTQIHELAVRRCCPENVGVVIAAKRYGRLHAVQTDIDLTRVADAFHLRPAARSGYAVRGVQFDSLSRTRSAPYGAGFPHRFRVQEGISATEKKEKNQKKG